MIWESENKKQARDLKSIGLRALKVLIKNGRVLEAVSDENECAVHNDRIALIKAMVGPKMPQLLDSLCKRILELTSDAGDDGGHDR